MLKAIIFYFLPSLFGFSIVIFGEDFAFDRPRPLMALCGEIQDKYGILVTYEDAPLDPVNELNSAPHPRTGATVLTPRWRPITFRVPSSLPTVAERSASQNGDLNDLGQSLAAVQEVVDQYNKSGNPGRFTVVQDGKYLHIEQTARMVSGNLQSFEPISNTVVAWQSKSQTCQQVLSDLFSALRQLRGVTVVEGPAPMTSLLTHHCNVDGNSLATRQILAAVTEGLGTNPVTGRKMLSYTWDLVYDPNSNKYFLSFWRMEDTLPSAAVDTTPPDPKAAKSVLGERLRRGAPPRSVKPQNLSGQESILGLRIRTLQTEITPFQSVKDDCVRFGLEEVPLFRPFQSHA